MLQLIKNNKIFFTAYITVLMIAITILMLFNKEAIHIVINQNYSFLLDYFFKYATMLGEPLVAISIMITFLFIRFRYTFLMLINVLATTIIVQSAKFFVFKGFPRPRQYFSGIYDLRFILDVNVHKWNSFPSGHTTLAFTLCTCLVLCLKYKNRFLNLIFLFLAIMVAYSRMYLSQHFLIDTVAGSLIGVIVSFIGYYIVEKSNKKWLDKSLMIKVVSKIRVNN